MPVYTYTEHCKDNVFFFNATLDENIISSKVGNF